MNKTKTILRCNQELGLHERSGTIYGPHMNPIGYISGKKLEIHSILDFGSGLLTHARLQYTADQHGNFHLTPLKFLTVSAPSPLSGFIYRTSIALESGFSHLHVRYDPKNSHRIEWDLTDDGMEAQIPAFMPFNLEDRTIVPQDLNDPIVGFLALSEAAQLAQRMYDNPEMRFLFHKRAA